MLIPKRPASDLTEENVESIIINKVIDFTKLDNIIPKGVANTWSAKPEDRIQYGFKYEWNQTEGSEVVAWHVHGHAPDPKAPQMSNASNGWIVRIMRKNRYLLDTTYTPQTAGNPSPTQWGGKRSNATLPMSHIKATNEALRTGIAHEAPEAATRILGTNIPVLQGLTRRNSLK